MSEIQIVVKPENISYDSIHDLLLKAHEENIKNGIFMKSLTMTGEEIKKLLDQDGRCFVAMDGDKIVGTASYRIITINRWYHRGKTGQFMLGGILPEYRGKHIFQLLAEIVITELKEAGINTIQFATAEKNTRIQEICIKDNYNHVDFYAPKENLYMVEMFKWLDKCPFPKVYCSLRFHLKKIYTKLRFKPGRVKRFGI